MKKVEIPEKLLEIAAASGLSEEQLLDLLTGRSDIPQDLMALFEKITEKTTDVCAEE